MTQLATSISINLITITNLTQSAVCICVLLKKQTVNITHKAAFSLLETAGSSLPSISCPWNNKSLKMFFKVFLKKKNISESWIG